MSDTFNNKINVLKALAIMLIVSGHLEFSLIPMFPPFSFHLALFFFISGYLFKDKYIENICDFITKKAKRLLLPYFLYTGFYLVITIIIAKLTGKFWGMPVNIKNYTITPFLNGHELDLSCPLWFVPQLFISLIFFLFLFKKLKELRTNKYLNIGFFFVLAVLATSLTPFRYDEFMLVVIRTLFSLFFIYSGYFYKNYVEEKINIFNYKWLFCILIVQSLLWLTNKDYTPQDGVGLSYVLVWGEFDDVLIPVLTSLTGIWAAMFLVDKLYLYIKDNRFFYQMGKNTYHIMANHVFIMYLITCALLYIKGIPIDIKNAHDIYWIYNPIKTTYFYFVVTMILSTYSGVFLNFIKEKFVLNNTKSIQK